MGQVQAMFVNHMKGEELNSKQLQMAVLQYFLLMWFHFIPAGPHGILNRPGLCIHSVM